MDKIKSFSRAVALVALWSVALLLGSCSQDEYPRNEAGARQFLQDLEKDLEGPGKAAAHAAWIAANFITYDSQELSAYTSEQVKSIVKDYAVKAPYFDGIALPLEVRRQLEILKGGLTLPPPGDPTKSKRLSEIEASLEGTYGKGTYCQEQPDGTETCRNLGELSEVMAKSRNYNELLEAWKGWRTISPPMRSEYQELVQLGNEGARDLGYDDIGHLWRSGYDMRPDTFVQEMDRLWDQVKPFYTALHCHVRAKLNERYGDDQVPLDKPIPAHLLGNMWAQQWGNVYDLIKPAGSGSGAGYDLDALLADTDEIEMVRIAEKFFTSLGFEPLPKTFWDRSLFLKPRDRDVVCHASAWNLDDQDDIRIKMCIKPDAEDFSTIHHELGHNFYQRAYKHQPLLLRGGANDGFHEAIGDTIALSITPDYLVKIGMLEEAPRQRDDISMLLRQALDKIAFLPFGLLIDKWRWQVFSGELPEGKWNQGWWDLRLKYQGIVPPVERTEDNFDPGAKYHIPGNTPYMRYFLAHIQQFQFHKALCKSAGYEGPLHLCTVYDSKEAGERLIKALEMGLSRPWQDTMEVLAGQRSMDASVIQEYFAPLKIWLDEQNAGRTCGW